MALCMVSCHATKVDPEFLTTNTTGLTVKGSTVFTFDPLTCQTAFNREKGEFRVHTDNMSDYYCVSLSTIPTSQGQKAKGDIIWTSKSQVQTKRDLSFQVEKVDRSGRLWLWSRKEAIGVLVQILD